MFLAVLLALVQKTWSKSLNYKDLTDHLMKLQTTDLIGLLSEGLRFSSIIMDWLNDNTADLHLHTTVSQKVRLRVHVGKTLTMLKELQFSCSLKVEFSSGTEVSFENVVSSFIKYKVYLGIYSRQ